MIEIRLHGRGGQGGVTAAELLAQTAISEGNYAQGFPSFGPERRGAPVTAYMRMDEKRLRIREPIENPDVVVVMDYSLMGMVDVFEGLKAGGTLVINAPEAKRGYLEETAAARGANLAIVDASAIASEVLGVPITNTSIIGAIVKATGFCELSSLQLVLESRFGRLASKNIAAMQRAHEETLLVGNYSVSAVEAENDCRVEALYPYEELEIAAEITTPGSSAEFLTGNWRTSGRPVTDYEKCIRCGFCQLLCPDIAYQENEEGYFDWDSRYCKGCAICVVECPKGAIEMRGEFE